MIKVKTSKLHCEGQLVQPPSLLWGNICWLMMSYFQSNPWWKESFWNDTFISTSRTPGVFVVLDPVTLMAASLYLEIQSVQTTQIVTVGKKGWHKNKSGSDLRFKRDSGKDFQKSILHLLQVIRKCQQTIVFRDSPSSCFCRGWPARWYFFIKMVIF